MLSAPARGGAGAGHDDGLFEEFLDWLTVLLRERGLVEGTVEAGLRSLATVITYPRLLAVLGLDAAVPGA